jgi:hypothetical protein
MRRAVVVPAVLLAVFFTLGRSGEARAAVAVEAGVDLGLFHDRLAVHGDWIHLDAYGDVWTPRHVAHGWRPYISGHWVFTDYDWTWVSDDPWGWATDHYGRWLFDPDYGWVWVPGPVWGPAWVAWRSGDGFVGWAPLPPGIEVAAGDLDVALDPFAFCFVEERFLLEPALAVHILPSARNVTLVRGTRNITRYEVAGDRIVNRGVDASAIERASGHAITRLRLRDVDTVDEARGRVDSRSHELAVYRPGVRAGAPAPGVRSAAAAAARVETEKALRARQEKERRELRSTEAHEHERLQSAHRQESAHPPAGVSGDDLRDRQSAEEQAQAEHERREQRLLDARHERERRALPPPPPSAGRTARHR